MNITYYLILFILIILIFQNKLQKINKNLVIVMFTSILLLDILMKPEQSIESAITGAKLFFFKVFPSLFPFMILCNLIIYFNGVKIYSKLLGTFLCKPLKLPKECSLVLMISALCGYPLGAKYSCQLYEDGIIDFNTCKRLLNIATNSSPLFILGSVGISMLNNPPVAYILLISNYLSCLCMGLIIKPDNKKTSDFNRKRYTKASDNTPLNLGEIFKRSIDNSLNSCTSIFGSIVIFTVLLNMIKNTALFHSLISNSYIETFIIGVVEMTNGCSLVSNSNLIMSIKIIFISFFVTFSGLCIITQVYAFTYRHKLSMVTYVKNKFIQGIISSALSVVIYQLTINNRSLATLSTSMQTQILPISSLFIICSIILIIPFVLTILLNLFDFS
ncbi:MAG: sporulation integral membrane protein YlbJ [Bacillota bacterium]|nr:sporulation integral membrane protein YlbJ [Bacillota bacterium]